MTNQIVLSALVIGVLAMIFWTPALMSLGISKLSTDKLSSTEKVLCCIPVFNIIRAEYQYYGKPRGVLISTVLMFIGVASRVYLWRNFYDNVTVGTVSIVIFWLVILAWIVCNMVFVFTVINDAQALAGFKLFAFSVCFPFGQYFIGAYLGNVIRHMQQKEDTFKR